ncbi:MAG: ABC transporter ATP-binding protein [Candidatus Thermoplasmatota archaeon]|nr:ABC transporter ATP-binding protein [Candidatus Thermoplasmatota archaeon]MCL5731383.1 ABC transporter ATP-binding protein [Candidatus Thermoplasmatota archaeon]
MIRTESLKKTYQDGTEALSGITVRLEKRFTSIIGRNGAGKTTFIRILSTQLMPSSGEAYLDGIDLLGNPEKARREIVSIPQESAPIGILTPFELIKMYLVARGFSFKEAHDQAIATLDTLDLREYRDKPSDTLSGGTKRKVFVCMALASNASTVFLDEPTTGLDPLSRLEVWSALKVLQGNVILTTHYMEEAKELSNEVLLIDSGKVIDQGTVDSLLSRFKGLVRAESLVPKPDTMRIGGLYIRYIKYSEAQDYISQGFDIKAITLDDVFIKHGVTLES